MVEMGRPRQTPGLLGNRSGDAAVHQPPPGQPPCRPDGLIRGAASHGRRKSSDGSGRQPGVEDGSQPGTPARGPESRARADSQSPADTPDPRVAKRFNDGLGTNTPGIARRENYNR